MARFGQDCNGNSRESDQKFCQQAAKSATNKTQISNFAGGSAIFGQKMPTFHFLNLLKHAI